MPSNQCQTTTTRGHPCTPVRRMRAASAGRDTPGLRSLPRGGGVTGAAMSQNVPGNDPSRAPPATPAPPAAPQNRGKTGTKPPHPGRRD